MYFFLSNLSFLDMCYTTSIVPQLLVNLSRADKSISFGGCVVQMYISLELQSLFEKSAAKTFVRGYPYDEVILLTVCVFSVIIIMKYYANFAKG